MELLRSEEANGEIKGCGGPRELNVRVALV